MTRGIYYALIGLVALVALWFVADAPSWWSARETPFRGPLGPAASALGTVPCAALTEEQQAALSYGGNRPAESCRMESADTTIVLLRAADSTVVSLVRVWRPASGTLDTEYDAASARLTAEWGESRTCPENDQRGAVGDRVWSRSDSHVRLYKRLPDQLVLDYELGPGGCQIPF